MTRGQPNDAAQRQAGAALGSLSKLADGAVTGVILVLQRGNRPPDISQLRPTKHALPALTDVVRAAAQTYADSELIEYMPAATAADGQVMWIRAAGVPLLQEILSESASLSGLPLFDPKKASLASLQLAAMRAVKDTTSAVFLQSLRGNQVVAQSRRIGVIVRRGVVDIPASGEILLFSKDVAVVVVGDFAFFTDRPAFQRLFGYLDDLRRNAATTFRTVTQGLRIEGIDQMEAAVTGSPAMLGKMASIQRKLDELPEYRTALTMPRLVAFAKQHPEYQVDITEDGSLRFQNDPQHRFKILKLLDDDYLHSELTSLEYEANSKSTPLRTTSGA